MLRKRLRRSSRIVIAVAGFVVVTSTAIAIGRSIGRAVVARRPFPLTFETNEIDLGSLRLDDTQPVFFCFPFANATDAPVVLDMGQVILTGDPIRAHKGTHGPAQKERSGRNRRVLGSYTPEPGGRPYLRAHCTWLLRP